MFVVVVVFVVLFKGKFWYPLLRVSSSVRLAAPLRAVSEKTNFVSMNARRIVVWYARGPGRPPVHDTSVPKPTGRRQSPHVPDEKYSIFNKSREHNLVVASGLLTDPEHVVATCETAVGQRGRWYSRHLTKLSLGEHALKSVQPGNLAKQHPKASGVMFSDALLDALVTLPWALAWQLLSKTVSSSGTCTPAERLRVLSAVAGNSTLKEAPDDVLFGSPTEGGGLLQQFEELASSLSKPVSDSSTLVELACRLVRLSLRQVGFTVPNGTNEGIAKRAANVLSRVTSCASQVADAATEAFIEEAWRLWLASAPPSRRMALACVRSATRGAAWSASSSRFLSADCQWWTRCVATTASGGVVQWSAALVNELMRCDAPADAVLLRQLDIMVEVLACSDPAGWPADVVSFVDMLALQQLLIDSASYRQWLKMSSSGAAALRSLSSTRGHVVIEKLVLSCNEVREDHVACARFVAVVLVHHQRIASALTGESAMSKTLGDLFSRCHRSGICSRPLETSSSLRVAVALLDVARRVAEWHSADVLAFVRDLLVQLQAAEGRAQTPALAVAARCVVASTLSVLNCVEDWQQSASQSWGDSDALDTDIFTCVISPPTKHLVERVFASLLQSPTAMPLLLCMWKLHRSGDMKGMDLGRVAVFVVRQLVENCKQHGTVSSVRLADGLRLCSGWSISENCWTLWRRCVVSAVCALQTAASHEALHQATATWVSGVERTTMWEASLRVLSDAEAAGNVPPELFLHAMRTLKPQSDEQRSSVDIGVQLIGDGTSPKGPKRVFYCPEVSLDQPLWIPSTRWQQAASILHRALHAPVRSEPVARRLRSVLRTTADAALSSIALFGSSDFNLHEAISALSQRHGVYVSAGTLDTCASSDSTESRRAVSLRGSKTSFHVVGAEIAELFAASGRPAGGWQRALQLLLSCTARDARMLSSHAATSSVFGEALRRVAEARSWSAACMLLHRYHAHNSNLCGAVQHSGAVRRGSVDDGDHKIVVSRSTLHMALQLLADAARWYEAVSVVSHLATPAVSVAADAIAWPSGTAYLFALQAARRAKQWAAALHVFDQLHRDAFGSKQELESDGSSARHPSESRPVVTISFAHVGEFVGCLLQSAPLYALQCSVGKYTKSASSPHLVALMSLLQSQSFANSDGIDQRPVHDANVGGLAGAEMYFSLLSRDIPNPTRHPHVWAIAMSVFVASTVELAAANPSPQVLSARSILSLLQVLRTFDRWQESLFVHRTYTRWSRGSSSPETASRMLYMVLATAGRHSASWLSCCSLVARTVRDHPRVSRDPRLCDRFANALMHAPEPRWMDALGMFSQRPHPRQHLSGLSCPAPPNGHILELVLAKCANLSVAARAFDELVRRNALPVAISHSAAPAVLWFARRLLATRDYECRTDPLTVLVKGIRNAQRNMGHLEALGTHSAPSSPGCCYTPPRVTGESRDAFARNSRALAETWHAAELRSLAVEAAGGAEPTEQSRSRAQVCVHNLLAAWRADSTSCSCMLLTHEAVLQDLSTVLERTLGDTHRAAMIRDWLAELRP